MRFLTSTASGKDSTDIVKIKPPQGGSLRKNTWEEIKVKSKQLPRMGPEMMTPGEMECVAEDTAPE